MVATIEEGGSRREKAEADGEEEDLFAPRGADLARKNAGRAGGGRGKDGDEVEEVFGRTGERNYERLAGRRGDRVLKGMQGENEEARTHGGEGGCHALGGGGQRQEEQGQRESDLGRARASETERKREEEAEARASDTEREREEEAERIMATLDEVCACVRACVRACVFACVAYLSRQFRAGSFHC